MTIMSAIHDDEHSNLDNTLPTSSLSTSSSDENRKIPVDAPARKHFSIDLSLELERQLTEMESPPPTPGAELTHKQHQSLDQEVLAHIVRQLQQGLAEMTKERDELVKLLSDTQSQDATLKDALQLMTDKATELEEEMSLARRKMKDDEDAITLLRAKVEESRRGLMRVQAESRRQTGDAQWAGISSFGTTTANKRASFTPLTGSLAGGRPATAGHRRMGSDASLLVLPTPDPTSPSPRPQNFTFPEGSGHAAPPVSSRRFSGLFGSPSPPIGDSTQESLMADVEALRKEVRQLRDDLDGTKHELSEANEAREASETCANALREFIADNNVGAVDLNAKFPPLPPTRTSGEEAETRSGWGFKLWKADAVPRPQNTTGQLSSPAISSPMVSPASSIGVSVAQAPLARKIGGFFSSRTASISSAASLSSPTPIASLPHLQTNAAQRESIYSFSDASSVAEPISPGSDIDGLGTGPAVVGKDVTNLPDLDVGHNKGLGMNVSEPRIVLG